MSPGTSNQEGITGRMADLYDVFVDWPGRLGRELPGLRKHLEGAGARRVLDVGCGTGRHVRALLDAGYDAHGADVSPDMLDQAAELLGGSERLHAWRLGDAAPGPLVREAPFDAVLCLGNVWPQILTDADLARTGEELRRLLRPGGIVVVGLKAVAVRRESGNPYLPLMKRRHEGRPIWFVRFVDFDVPPLEDGTEVCDFHMVVAAGASEEGEGVLHRSRRLRVWSPDALRRWFGSAGFSDAKVSGRLDDPDATPAGEDVFVSASVR